MVMGVLIVYLILGGILGLLAGVDIGRDVYKKTIGDKEIHPIFHALPVFALVAITITVIWLPYLIYIKYHKL